MTTYSPRQVAALTELPATPLQQWAERGLIDFITEHSGDRTWRRFSPANVDLLAIMVHLHRAGFSPATSRAIADRIFAAIPGLKILDGDRKTKLPRVAITLREMRPQTASNANVDVAVIAEGWEVHASAPITLVVNLESIAYGLRSGVGMARITEIFEQIETKVQEFVETQEKAAESASTRSQQCA